jgi:FMN phosphatase YigB (HAD superfamily)
MLSGRLRGAFAAFRRALANRGGGWRGTWSIAARTVSVVRMLGWRGLLGRLQAAAHVAQPRPAGDSAPRPAAVPVAQVGLKVGVALHLFHVDLLEEFRDHFANIPVPFTLLVSVPDEEGAERARAGFAGLAGLRALSVRDVANRGRDWAPLLVDFRDELRALDLVCHVHSKKSLYTGRRRDDWRGSLLDALLGSQAKVEWILGMFQADPRLGLVFPETFAAIPYWAHGWLQNAATGAELARRLGFAIDPDASFDYPVGSMFWTRVDALRPLLDLGLSTRDFPAESGQTDGTLQHALERLVAPAALHRGYRLGILPSDGSLAMADEGDRNWRQALDGSLHERFRLAAAGATAISVDVFDTLLLRPFLSPAGFHDHVGHLASARLGCEGFAASRQQAEHAARLTNGRDPDLDDIRRALAGLRPDLPAGELLQLERDNDAAQLRPRTALVDALARGHSRPVMALSDTYYHAAELRPLLPAALQARIGAIEASCETGARKDSGEAWRRIAQAPGRDPARWLHVGDNACSDVQVPQDLGFRPPLHVLRPAALLELVPALRALHPGPATTTAWQDSLWLGLVANRLAEIADAEPACFRDGFVVPDAGTLGYVVVGPLLHDFVAWTARDTLLRGGRDLLFLAREGWLFERCFRRLAETTGRLRGVHGRYFLASRRATGLAGLREGDDLARLFGGTYSGPLAALLRSRLGMAAAELARDRGLDGGDAFLPEMRDAIAQRLAPLLPALRALAQAERDAYREYSASVLDDDGADGAIPTVVDIGYSGTIQANLARVLGRPLHGAYMALRAGATPGDGLAARYFDGRSGAAPSSSPILRSDLLLETLLTAPAGQLSHFGRDAGGVVPRYVPGTEPAGFAIIEAGHAGAMAFVDDLHRVAGEDALDLSFDLRLGQAAVACLGDGRWKLGAWAAGLGVDDDYSGRGVVPLADGPG